MNRQLVLRFNLESLPVPTVPPISWAEARETYKRGPVVSAPQDAADYFRRYIGGKPNESFLCMYLDHRNHVLDVVLESEGTVDHAAVYPRQILKRALDLGATSCILSHNHPAGSLEPSEGDKALTRQIVTGARALGVSIHDHLIVTQEVAGSIPVNPAILKNQCHLQIINAFACKGFNHPKGRGTFLL